jgi:hypothetical protein
VLSTPSHVALFLSISVTVVGSVIVFAAARDQRWAKVGILLAIPVLITFAPITAQGLSTLSLPFRIDPVTATTIFVATTLQLLGATTCPPACHRSCPAACPCS